MKITPLQLAKLVLGYLKSEKCKSAAEEFIDTSPHLKHVATAIRSKRHLLTRVNCCSLADIIDDYAHMYTIIQEYLDDTPYFSEHPRAFIYLPHQLSYLLKKGRQSRSTTPLRSRSSTPINLQRDTRTEPLPNLSVIAEDPDCEVNATPLHDLPGNDDVGNGPIEESEPETGVSVDEDFAKLMTETLLRDHTWHERLAANINSVCFPANAENVQKAQDDKVSNEVDTAIDSIVQKTETDPAFEKLVSELMGSNDQPERQENKPEEKTSMAPNQHVEPTQDCSTSETMDKKDEKDDSSNTNSAEVMLYDGTIDKLMKDISTTTSNAPVLQSSNLVINNGLLMVHPIHQPSYYLVKSSQIVSAPPCKTNSLTEQDILSMPTIIVSDESQQNAVTSTNVDQEKRRSLQKIAPKERLDSTQPINAAQLGLNKLQRRGRRKPDTSTQIQAMHVMVNPEKFRNDKISTEVDTRKEIVHDHKEKDIEVTKELTSKQSDNPTINDGAIARDPENINNDGQAETKSSDMEKRQSPARQGTPKLKTAATNKGTSTPRSGSHVRALDFKFGTPRQSAANNKKPTNSPKKRSPARSGQPKVSKSLFTTPAKDEQHKSATRKDEKPRAEKKRSLPRDGAHLKSWDADLRALAGTCSARPLSPKKKRRRKEKDLNTTDVDAKAIEAILLQEEIPKHIDEKANKPKESGRVIEIVNDNEDNHVEVPPTLINVNGPSRIKRKCNEDVTIKKDVKVTKIREIKSLDLKLNVKTGDEKAGLIDKSTREFTFGDHSTTLINLNGPSRIKKKCNIDNVGQVQMDKEVKSKEFSVIEENKEVNDISFSAIYQCFNDSDLITLNYCKSKSDEVPKTKEEEPSKFITPDFSKPIQQPLPMSANRNLMSLLETPIKTSLEGLENIGNMVSPITIQDTPITKIFKEQLEGIDLTSIQTPKFPLTPNLLSLTPFVVSPYRNRPTDYSTSSSYYQPSDTEQNKSIDKLIEDSKREHLQPKKLSVEEVASVVTDKLLSFNKNVIGRKNLSLVSKVDTASFGDSSSEEQDDVGSPTSENSKDTTVIHRTDASRYSLRSRGKPSIQEISVGKEKLIEDDGKEEHQLEKEKNDASPKEKVEDKPTSIENNEQEIKEKEDSLVENKFSILTELKEKRDQTIAKFKQRDEREKTSKRKKSPAKKLQRTNIPKHVSFKGSKSKNRGIEHRQKETRVKPRENKRDSNSKSLKPTSLSFEKILKQDEKNPEKTEIEVLGSNRKKKEEEILEITSNKVLVDENEDCLVRDLKERGIYLLPKKKKSDATILDPPDDNSSMDLLPEKNSTEKHATIPLSASKSEDAVKETKNDQQDKGERVMTPPSEIQESEKHIKDEEKDEIKNEKNEKEVIKNEIEDSKVEMSEEIYDDQLEEDLNLSDSIEEISFDACLKSEEDQKIIFTPKNSSRKTLKDYNLELSNKSFTATVFLDEINAEVKRVIKATPLDIVFDFSERGEEKKDKVKILQMITLKKSVTPLRMLYNELVDSEAKPDDKLTTSSPLENLYDNGGNSSTRSGQIRRSERRRTSSDAGGHGGARVSTGRASSLDQRSRRQSQREKKSVESSEEILGARGKKKETKIVEAENSKVQREELSLLGNILGSPTSKSSTKRKGSDYEADKKKRPKQDCQAILKNLGVDHFLSQIHKN